MTPAIGYHRNIVLCLITMSSSLSLNHRKALLFALTAERLSTFYEHGQWLTEAQGATLAANWLARHNISFSHSERKGFSALSDAFARELAQTVSREAGLYMAHEMMEALSPHYASEFALDLMDECERRLRAADLAE
jgi:hypothetical protein